MAEDVVSWVPGPTERGTMTLVWSCVITVFACTWTVLHLNVPGRGDSSLTVALRKLKWMVINIIFPEFVFSKAVCDLRLALQELQEFDDEFHKIGFPNFEWTTRHDIMHPHFHTEKSHFIRWGWTIEYPDGWSGLLYDLLWLRRPPHMRQTALRRFLRRFKLGASSASTNPADTTLELGTIRSSCLQSDVGSIDTADNSSRSSSIQPHISLSNAVERSGRSHFNHRNPRSSERVNVIYCTQSILQEWTVVHSYYAQMGGLVFPHERRRVSTLTASHLTSRFIWNNTEHPIMHLVLGKDEIQDKSKADWFLKSLAVIQVAWVITNVLVRYITRLPISQIELATVAFSIMAVLIYLANWWKPKDISCPTMLQFLGQGRPHGAKPDAKQSFIQRILSPTETVDKCVPVFVERVANDIVWLEGDIPLLFYLMAGSSFVFGALHCIAWNFEFPTTVELICWRVASLASAILPGVALAISAILGHIAVSNFSPRHIEPKLSAALDLVLPAEWRRMMIAPRCVYWHHDAQSVFLRMPKTSRDWEVEPTSDMIEQWGAPEKLHEHPWVMLAGSVKVFYGCMSHRDSLLSWNEIAQKALSCNTVLGFPEATKALDLWREYEDFLISKDPDLRPAVVNGTATTYLEQILNVAEKVSIQEIMAKKRTEQASNFVFITSIILYTAARLTILTLLFTSLRAAPAGVYQDTTWTRFLPKFS